MSSESEAFSSTLRCCKRRSVVSDLNYFGRHWQRSRQRIAVLLPSGIDSRRMALIAALTRKGHSVTVYLPNEETHLQTLRDIKCRVRDKVVPAWLRSSSGCDFIAFLLSIRVLAGTLLLYLWNVFTRFLTWSQSKKESVDSCMYDFVFLYDSFEIPAQILRGVCRFPIFVVSEKIDRPSITGPCCPISGQIGKCPMSKFVSGKVLPWRRWVETGLRWTLGPVNCQLLAENDRLADSFLGPFKKTVLTPPLSVNLGKQIFEDEEDMVSADEDDFNDSDVGTSFVLAVAESEDFAKTIIKGFCTSDQQLTLLVPSAFLKSLIDFTKAIECQVAILADTEEDRLQFISKSPAILLYAPLDSYDWRLPCQSMTSGVFVVTTGRLPNGAAGQAGLEVEASESAISTVLNDLRFSSRSRGRKAKQWAHDELSAANYAAKIDEWLENISQESPDTEIIKPVIKSRLLRKSR